VNCGGSGQPGAQVDELADAPLAAQATASAMNARFSWTISASGG
jgi:hypothetical protein